MTRGCAGWLVLGGWGDVPSGDAACARVQWEMWRLGGCVLRVRRVPRVMTYEELLVQQAVLLKARLEKCPWEGDCELRTFRKFRPLPAALGLTSVKKVHAAREPQSPCLPLACRPSAHADTSPETAGDAHRSSRRDRDV